MPDAELQKQILLLDDYLMAIVRLTTGSGRRRNHLWLLKYAADIEVIRAQIAELGRGDNRRGLATTIEYLRDIMSRLVGEPKAGSIMNAHTTLSRPLTQNVATGKKLTSTTVGYAIERILSISAQLEDSLRRFPLGSDLDGIVPDQQIGPYRFKVERSRLSIEYQPGGATGLDAQNAAQALAGLIDLSERIARDLSVSNASPRLKEAFAIVVSKLQSGANIIDLAEENGTFNDQIEADDIPSETLRSLLRSHSKRIRDYVAQFPEWRAFAANAADVEFDREKLLQMGRVARSAAQKLVNEPNYVDASVPEALNNAARWSETKNPTGREKLAVHATILNLLAKTAMWTLGITGAAAGVLATETGDVGAKVVAVTIVGEIEPYLSAISETADGKWAKPAVKYLKDYLAETTGEK
ncbi:hypothetical protein [Rhizobium leguminosarum]|uniref:hypothetical protein n=1 Tax=Rhizobium leguminosarum TaxID=384 RepID=UPI0003FB95F7|nr:hypothetical protein [Rhizobium leguminosarum]MBY5416969.1 hypothetical protein [Rhizobium leguminosarum]